MKTKEEIQEIARKVVDEETKAIENLKHYINDDFARAVMEIFECKGRVVLTGIGKSANIATKIVSTLNSTGTPAVFMHAADAIHGDLGIVQHDDIVICVSKSGNTPEIKVLVPLIKGFGNTLIALVGNTGSFLAEHADMVLDATVEHEACPNNLAPTSSTTAQLVMGDALAVALIECRNFSARDFARFHPGGALGKQLYMRVSDLYKQNERPCVTADTTLRETLLEMTTKRLGCTVVVDQISNGSHEGENILGIITDGDLRRMMKNYGNLDGLTAKDIMTAQPKTVQDTEFAVKALNIMRNNSITQLIVLDATGDYVGILHIHDILNEGII
ncbi:MAG: KpsF/GutQ family sugar-phosphate isomerase [Bacteroidales bacterium]|nr:KpsF/GutQ family sugar-phosphate isomerase [Bacteroidales bacterium]